MWQRLSRRVVGDARRRPRVTATSPACPGAARGDLAARRAVPRRRRRTGTNRRRFVWRRKPAYHLIALVLRGRGRHHRDRRSLLLPRSHRRSGRAACGCTVPAPGRRRPAGRRAAARAATLAYVTPCHQFPLGGALSLRAPPRAARLGSQHGGLRRRGPLRQRVRRAPAARRLQSLDRDGRVIYVGTFSTRRPALGLRVWLPRRAAAPRGGVPRLPCAVANVGSARSSCRRSSRLSSARGHFVRHVRRMRQGALPPAPPPRARRGALADGPSARLPDRARADRAAPRAHGTTRPRRRSRGKFHAGRTARVADLDAVRRPNGLQGPRHGLQRRAATTPSRRPPAILALSLAQH